MINTCFAIATRGLGVSLCLLFLAASSLSVVAFEGHASSSQSPEHIVAELVEGYDPCAGSPAPAVCRCALEFPPVTYDTTVDFALNSTDSGTYDIATGRTLMNLVRAIVVATQPGPVSEGEPPIKLYANPPATPDAMEQLDAVVKRNPNFSNMKLVDIMMMPRSIGGEADRLYGGIWWLSDSKTLLVIFRGTQTPFEWYLDTRCESYRKISGQFDVAFGFGTGYAICQDVLLKAIQAYQPSRVIIGGHSLGGAMTATTALDLYQRSMAAGKPYSVHAITFGQPRTFSPESASLVDEAIESGDLELWRVVNMADPVPTVPPAATSAKAVKFKHTSSIALYDDDVSSRPGHGAAWNHHWYYDGYFAPGVQGLVGRPVQ